MKIRQASLALSSILSLTITFSPLIANAEICSLNNWCELKNVFDKVGLTVDESSATLHDGLAFYACRLKVAGVYDSSKEVWISLQGEYGYNTGAYHFYANQGDETIFSIFGKFTEKNALIKITRLESASPALTNERAYILCQKPPF